MQNYPFPFPCLAFCIKKDADTFPHPASFVFFGNIAARNVMMLGPKSILPPIIPRIAPQPVPAVSAAA